MEQLRKQLEWSKKQTKFAWKKFYQQKEKNDEKMKEMEKIIKELKKDNKQLKKDNKQLKKDKKYIMGFVDKEDKTRCSECRKFKMNEQFYLLKCDNNQSICFNCCEDVDCEDWKFFTLDEETEEIFPIMEETFEKTL